MDGKFIINTINTKNASKVTIPLITGEKLNIPKYQPHQIVSIIGGDIIEVSTHDDENDSYRVEEGSSQKNCKTCVENI